MDEKYVEDRTIFKTIVGSRAYGTNTPESDTDIRGIAVMDDPRYYFGYLDKFEQFEDNKKDIVIYDVRKAFKLMADANPNMLDLLFADERFHQHVHPEFMQVIENRDKFLSKNVRYRYTGYAFAQLKRIRTARSWLLNPPKAKPERSDFGLPDNKLLSKDDIGAFHKVMANLLEGSVEYMNFSDSTKEELQNVNWIGLIQSRGIKESYADEIQKMTGASDAWMDMLQREQKYITAKKHFDSYTQWKKSRNKKRAVLEEKYGYDPKHAMHLIRLMRLGVEILETGKVNVFRPDREELIAIRNGAWTYDQVEEYAESMENKIINLYETSHLPHKPNYKFINKMCVDIISKLIKG